MQKRQNETEINFNKRLLSVSEAMQYTSLGRCTLRTVGEEVGAIRKVGKRVLFDRLALDAWVDSGKAVKAV